MLPWTSIEHVMAIACHGDWVKVFVVRGFRLQKGYGGADCEIRPHFRHHASGFSDFEEDMEAEWAAEALGVSLRQSNVRTKSDNFHIVALICLRVCLAQ